MINNTCQVCGRTIYAEPYAPASGARDAGLPSPEAVNVWVNIGDWARTYRFCENCAKRFTLEVESFIHDSRAFRVETLGELQDRLDSIAQGA